MGEGVPFGAAAAGLAELVELFDGGGDGVGGESGDVDSGAVADKALGEWAVCFSWDDALLVLQVCKSSAWGQLEMEAYRNAYLRNHEAYATTPASDKGNAALDVKQVADCRSHLVSSLLAK